MKDVTTPGLTWLLLTVVLAACHRRSPQEYREELTTQHRKVLQEVAGMSRMMKAADSLTAQQCRVQVLKVVDESISAVRKVDPYEGDAHLRDALLNLMRFYKETYTGPYQRIIALAKNSSMTSADKDSVQYLIDITTMQERRLDAAYSEAHRAFVNKYP